VKPFLQESRGGPVAIGATPTGEATPDLHGAKPHSEKRNEAIDAFRGVAIISVLLFHYMVRWAPPWNEANLYGYRTIYPAVLGLGALGVHLFFVISGVVITMTVLRSQNSIDFAVKRLARLYPAYLFGLMVTLTITTLSTISVFKVGFGDVLANLTMFPADLHHKAADGAYWSLAVEIKFYFVVAIAYAFLRGQFWIGILAAAAVGLALYEGGHRESFFLVPYAPFFLMGMAIWFGLFERMNLPAVVLALSSALAYFSFRHDYEIPHLPAYLPHVYILISVAAFVAVLAQAGRFRFWPLSGVGKVSYSLYLIHQNVGVIIIASLTAMGLGDVPAFLGAFGVCLAAATAMFVYIEQPGQRFVLRTYRRVAGPARPGTTPVVTAPGAAALYDPAAPVFETGLRRPRVGGR
jgi:peptidoglycan/LPS O-acetylase OafA/YrhL